MNASDTPRSNPIFVSVKEAARRLGLTPFAILELCEAGLIGSRHDDGRVLVDAESARDYAPRLGRVIA